MRLTVKDINIANGISTDSRTLLPGETFFALKGDNHDGHDHLEEAVLRGAGTLVVSSEPKVPEGFAGGVVAVSDTLRAYQDLAAYYRRKLNPLVIAVTGSVGKTTLKDMIACILSGSGRRAHYTKGNYNNQVGLPKTILSAEEGTEVLVLEMGMDHAGQIERLADIARPDVCVITNIGVSHRENFDSDDGILKAKFEVAAYLGPGDTLVIDADGSAELKALAAGDSKRKGYEVVYVTEKIEVPASGAYAERSAAMAAACCAKAGITAAEAAEALKKLKRTPHRLEGITGKYGAVVIDDSYNASPDSVRSGLEYLAGVPAKRRIAVLADMNELGADSAEMHYAAGALAAEVADIVYAYGENEKAGEMFSGASGLPYARYFPTGSKDEMIALLRENVREGDAVYIKGSRSMKMEEVAAALTEGE